MTELLTLTTYVHASLGFVCLASGAVALATRKAQGRHPASGRIFAVSLALLYLAILINIVAKTNLFMLGMGWLAVYASIEGWRALLRFQDRLPATPSLIDRGLAGITLALSLGLAIFGLWSFVNTQNLLGLVCVGFGLLGFGLVRAARRRWTSAPSKQQWLVVHIQLMTGAFSAALTAFLAIQLSGHLGGWEWVMWVAPTLIMSRYAVYEIKRRGLREDDL